MPEISIIIPAYNAGKYLETCIKSVVCQTFSCFEVIIIDDHSTDNTASIATKWSKQDKRIRLIKNYSKGVSSARNWGVTNAIGKYISFVDSDDLLSPVFLETLLSLIKTNSCQCAAVSFTSFFDELCVNVNSLKAITTEGQDIYKLLSCNRDKIGGYVWNKLYVAEILIKHNILFDEEIMVGEDMLFNFNYFKHIHSLVYCEDKLYYYKLNQDSSVNRLDNTKWFGLLRVYQYILKSDLKQDISDYFLYDFAQLILESLFRIQYCRPAFYTYEDLMDLKRDYVKWNSHWKIKENLKIVLFRMCPELAMKYKRRYIRGGL